MVVRLEEQTLTQIQNLNKIDILRRVATAPQSERKGVTID